MKIYYRNMPDSVKEKLLEEFPNLEFRWYFSLGENLVKGCLCGSLSSREQTLLILKYGEYINWNQ